MYYGIYWNATHTGFGRGSLGLPATVPMTTVTDIRTSRDAGGRRPSLTGIATNIVAEFN